MNSRPPTGRASSLSCSREVAGSDVGRQAGTLLLEFVKLAGKRLGVSVKAGGVAVGFQQGSGQAVAGRRQAAAHPPDGVFESAAHGIDHLRVGVKRLQVMGGQGVEVELFAQVLEKVLL